MRITDVTEKPPLEEVKSEYAVVGRYLLDPAVFTALENIEPGAGGEYQLTDGYARMIDLPEEQGGGLYGCSHRRATLRHRGQTRLPRS